MNADIGRLHETLFVSAVATVLIIRTQLWLTNYPQLGGGSLHIAHLLYGGIFMVLTIGLFLSVLGRKPRMPAAILGGIGFGFFIDELGKFITSNNDYFYQPAAGVIYVVFVALFMLSRYFRGRLVLTDENRLRNAIDLIGEATHGNFTESDRARALELLDGVDPSNPMAARLREVALQTEAIEDVEPSRLVRLAAQVRRRYLAASHKRWFERAITAIFGIWGAIGLLNLIAIALTLIWPASFDSATLEGGISFSNVAAGISSGIAASLMLAGLILIRRGRRIAGYEWLARGLLVSIFITQVFLFVETQFGAAFGLGIDIMLLVSVRLISANERRLEIEEPARLGPPDPVGSETAKAPKLQGAT